MVNNRRKLINKKQKKKNDKKCYFCSVDDYALLHVHRINYKENENKYTEHNTITVCANCHCKIHNEQIIIDRKYFSTSGKWVLHYWTIFENIKEEFWS